MFARTVERNPFYLSCLVILVFCKIHWHGKAVGEAIPPLGITAAVDFTEIIMVYLVTTNPHTQTHTQAVTTSEKACMY